MGLYCHINVYCLSDISSMRDLVSQNFCPWMEILSGDVDVYFSGVAVWRLRLLIDWWSDSGVAHFSMRSSRSVLRNSQ